MKAFTLTDYVDKKLKTDSQFSEHYAREQIINNVVEMIVDAKKTEINSQTPNASIHPEKTPSTTNPHSVNRVKMA